MGVMERLKNCKWKINMGTSFGTVIKLSKEIKHCLNKGDIIWSLKE